MKDIEITILENANQVHKNGWKTYAECTGLFDAEIAEYVSTLTFEFYECFKQQLLEWLD